MDRCGSIEQYHSDVPLSEPGQLPYDVLELCLLHHPQMVNNVGSLLHLSLELVIIGGHRGQLTLVRDVLLLKSLVGLAKHSNIFCGLISKYQILSLELLQLLLCGVEELLVLLDSSLEVVDVELEASVLLIVCLVELDHFGLEQGSESLHLCLELVAPFSVHVGLDLGVVINLMVLDVGEGTSQLLDMPRFLLHPHP